MKAETSNKVANWDLLEKKVKDTVALKKRPLIPGTDPFSGHYGANIALLDPQNLQYPKLPEQRHYPSEYDLVLNPLELNDAEREIVTELLKSPDWRPTARLTLGQSQTKVYLILKDDEREEYVVKIGCSATILAEVNSYQNSLQWKGLVHKNKLSKDSPVINQQLGGLVYELIGENKDKVVTLGQYLQHLEADTSLKDKEDQLNDLNSRFERAIVQTLEAAYEAWDTRDNIPIWTGHTFDRVLPPVALLDTNGKDTYPKPVRATDRIEDQVTQLKRNNVVALENFIVEEIRGAGKYQEITLNIPNSQRLLQPDIKHFRSNRIRLRKPKNEGSDYHEGQYIDRLVAKVIETRPDRFQVELREIPTLSLFNFNDEYFKYEKSNEKFPNPFKILNWVLKEYLGKVEWRYVAEIHGDFHAHNIMIHKHTGHLLGFIDFAQIHHDYVLHDFLRLERSLITWVFKVQPKKDNLIEVIKLYQSLDSAWRNIPNRFEKLPPDSRSIFASERTKILKELPPNSQPIFTAILAIRQFAYDFLVSKDHQEYYAGLLVYLLSSLKFHDGGQTNKEAAFGAALAVADFIATANHLKK